MAMQLKSGRLASPIRTLIYGLPKVGKTTVALDAPDPIVLSGEAGDGQFNVKRIMFDVKTERTWPVSWDEVTRELRALAAEPTLLGKTLVIDGLGALEKLCGSYICAKQKPAWGSISSPGFGKGEGELLKEMESFMKLVEQCWQKGYSIVFVAHSKIGKVQNPEGDAYQKHTPALSDHPLGDVSGFVVGWVDCVLFAQVEVEVAKIDKRAIGTGTGRHVFRTRNDPSHVGGCRYGNVPETIELDYRAFLGLVAEGQDAEKMTAKVAKLLSQVPPENDTFKPIADYVAAPGKKDVTALCRAEEKIRVTLSAAGVIAQAA